MDFSEPCRCSGPLAYSPDGRLLAVAVEYRLFIRDVDNLGVVQLYSCLDKIHTVEWSPNSTYVLCGQYDRAVVQVWSATEPEWTCKIDEGAAGVSHACWAPLGLSVVLVADFGVRVTVWSLMERKCSYLPGPKHTTRGIAFSPSGQALAVLQRREGKDEVALYSTSDWAEQERFQCATSDASDLAWSPSGTFLAVWDSCLGNKVCVYGAQGELLGSFSTPGDGLGVKSVQWGPGGDALALGAHDAVARVLNSVTWQPLLECHHRNPVDWPASLVVYREAEEPRGVLAPMQAPQGGRKDGARRETRSRYEVAPLPVAVTAVQAAPTKADPKIGVGALRWSPDSRFLATVNECMPHAAWVWDLHAGCLAALLLHAAPVRSVAWAPQGTRLALVAGVPRVYLWSPAGASVVHVPVAGFRACGVRWSPDAASLALSDADACCCAYVTTQQEGK